MRLTLAPTLSPEILAGVQTAEAGFTLTDLPGGSSEPWLIVLDPERSERDDLKFIDDTRKKHPLSDFIIVLRDLDFELLRTFLRKGILDCIVLPCGAAEWQLALERAAKAFSNRWLAWKSLCVRDGDDAQLAEMLGSRSGQWDEGAIVDMVQRQSQEEEKEEHTAFYALCTWIKFSVSGMDYQKMAKIGVALESYTDEFFAFRGIKATSMTQHGVLITVLRCDDSRDIRAVADEYLSAVKRFPSLSEVPVVIGLSGKPRYVLSEVYNQIHDATRAAYAHSSVGVDRVICYDDLRFDNPDIHEIFTPEYKSHISSLVEMADGRGLEEEIEYLRHTVGDGGADKTPLFSVYAELFDEYIETMRTLLPGDRAYYIQDQFNRAMQDCDTPEELTAAITKWTTQQLSDLKPTHDSAAVIRKAKRYIQKNFRHQLTRQNVADAVGLNPNYFSTFFSHETGQRFSEYLRDVRIAEAKRMLTETTESIAAIAEAVGYSEYRHFCKTFSHAVGESPSGYRKKARTGALR
jgi:AraC-like DNA-binding protein